MGFKSLDNYLADKNKDFFILPNDKDYAEVVFLYRSRQDVLVADVHYIKTPEYSGYVHCCGKGCPACAKGLRVEPKFFVPLFNYKSNKIEYWDRTRTPYFERQLEGDVLSKFPNPSEWVFRITRNGAAGSRDTRYTIVAVGKNSTLPYDRILADHGMTLPDGYSAVCRDYTAAELNDLLNATTAVPTTEYGYVPTPRAAATEYQPASTSIPEPVSITPPAFGEGPDSFDAVPGVTDVNAPEATTDDLGDVNF